MSVPAQDPRKTYPTVPVRHSFMYTATPEADDMARRRLQKKGDLYQQGGWWKLRWKEDQRLADGTIRYGWSKPVWIGPATGRGRLTEKQADRISWDNFLSRLDQNMRTPQSVMTVREFVERKFKPEHVATLKPAGRGHYASILPFVLDGVPEEKITKRKGFKRNQPVPVARVHGIGDARLRDDLGEAVQRLVSEALARNYSVQTATHIKNCVSAIFEHAESVGWFSGRNPAKHVRLPEMQRRPKYALSFEQLKAFLTLLKPLYRAMVLCASLTSMNVAEICGMRWKRVNLTSDSIVVDGEVIPAFHVAVREQWYLSGWGSVKRAARRRNLPMASLVIEALQTVRAMSKYTGPEDPVFASDLGRPVDEKNILRRHLRKAAAMIGVPRLGWHDLRRTFETLADQLGITMGERKALMGHSKASMTLWYNQTSTEQARGALEELAGKVKGTVN